jgi:uncharacterized protein YfbU (UPF0304 family)
MVYVATKESAKVIMKTIFVVYMPGHAGHFIARLFGLSPETIPLVNKRSLERTIIDTPNRLELYKFTAVKSTFKSWQDFHRRYADHKDSSNIRMANAVNGHKYSCVIYPIHPYEFHNDFQEIDETECYYVDLDLDLWGNWVSQQQQELKFEVREHEQEYFEQYKHQYNMQPISLTKLLGTRAEFQQEYLQITDAMKITPVLDQATVLLDDWKSVRVPK